MVHLKEELHMEGTEKKLRLMRYWLIGAYAIPMSAFITVSYLLFGTEFVYISQFWIVLGITGILFISLFYAYKYFISRE